MARLLAERLEAEGESAGAEISVGELLERYVPYGVARGSLELTTKSEYDLLVLRFLADRRLTVLGDPEVAEIASEELETPEPGLEPLTDHVDTGLRLDLATISGGYRRSEPGAAGSGGDEAGEPGPAPASEPAPNEEPESGEEVADGSPAADGSGESDAPGEGPEEGQPVESAGWDPTGGVHARPTAEPDEPGGENGVPADLASGGGRSRESRECRSCGEALPVVDGVAVRFCPHCGAARPERTCPECDTELRREWTYCPACGARASPSGGDGAA